jgi:hypothetical protein
MPAPRKNRKADHAPSVRPFIVLLDIEDRSALEALAGDMKLTLSDTVRSLIRTRHARLSRRPEQTLPAAS